MLSVEERNDLRKRVLQGQPLSVEEARLVIESLRTGAGAAMIAGGERKARKAKNSISDEQLDMELDAALGLG